MKRGLLSVGIFAVLFLISCAPAQKEPVSNVKVEQPSKETASVKTTPQTLSDVDELLSKYKTKVQSIYYKYRGPETGNSLYEFYVKDNRIKYIPAREIQSLDQEDSYDTIFIDKIGSTAQSYCLAAYCRYQGQKANLNFDKYYILTPFDWLSGITQAKKVGEEVIDDRSTWKIETNKGILWVDIFYGIPLKAEYGDKTYRYQQISTNSIKDSDLVPQ